MNNLKNIALLLFNLAVFSTLFSCKKEQDTFPQFPIQLTVKDSVGTTKLTWTKIETTDFIEYVVVRSLSDSVPAFSDLGVNQVIIGRISDAKRTETFDFQSNQIFTKSYYRVFARLQNRNLSSANVSVNSDIVATTMLSFSNIIQSEINPQQFYVTTSTNTNTMYLYDVEQEKVIAQNGGLPSSIQRIAFVTDNGANPQLVFMSYGNRRLNFYNANTLTQTGSIDITGNIYSITGSDEGFVFVCTDEYNAQFKAVKVSEAKVVSLVATTNNLYLNSSTIIEKVPKKREIIVHDGYSSTPTLYRMTYAPDGVLSLMSKIGTMSSGSYPSMRFSSTSKYLYVNGSLFDNSVALNLNQPLLTTQTSFAAFNTNETFVYFPQTQSSNKVFVDEYTLNNPKFARSITTKLNSGNGSKFFYYKNKIVVFATIFSNTVGNSITVYQNLNVIN